jgi:long-chain acyl-CoA synthetase
VASTVPAPGAVDPSSTTASRTIADLLPRAVAQFSGQVAQRYKRDGAWVDITYDEVGEIVRELALGLIDLGIESGERVCILANTRPEWTHADFAATSAGAVVVPIYPTNAPEECEWVAGNSEASAVICEDTAQADKIRAVRERLPNLRHLIVIEESAAAPDAVTFSALRERGRGRDPQEWVARYDAVTPDDPFRIIYTSGTTGPPKGCILTHRNYRAVTDMIHATGSTVAGETVYLYLPLAHAFALLIQLLSFDRGGVIAYWTGDSRKIIPELQETQPGYFPSVPRIFEKIYTLATSTAANASPEDQERFTQAVALGLKVRPLVLRGEPIPAELQAPFQAAEEQMFAKVRGIFGGRVRTAVTGAAPIAREILEFFYACGVPVLEGFGMTETATAATYSTVDSFRFGTVGRAIPGVEIRIADDGEILVKGANIFVGYYKSDDATFGAVKDGWLHTGDLGSLDEDGFLSITGRKKDIIITAGGKNLTPANLENDMKQSRWISQAVMHGDRRPFPVMLITLDAEEIVPWAREHGLAEDIPSLAKAPEVGALVQATLDQANSRYAQVEQVKKFMILDHDLSQETGELTPTLKVKRNVVNEKYATLFDELYA